MGKISMIVAVDQNLGIGKGNGLPWPNHSEDMKRFKEITKGKTIIMGRKTYETIGRPLPFRKNVILTRDQNYVDSPIYINSLKIEKPNFELCLAHDLKAILHAFRNEDVFIIGGAEIYYAAQDLVEELYITVIQGKFLADTTLDKFDFSKFRVLEQEHFTDSDVSKNPYSMLFQKCVRWVPLEKRPEIPLLHMDVSYTSDVEKLSKKADAIIESWEGTATVKGCLKGADKLLAKLKGLIIEEFKK